MPRLSPAARETSGGLQAPGISAEARRSGAVVASNPTPSQAAILTETVALLMRDLGDRERQIVLLGVKVLADITLTQKAFAQPLQKISKAA